MRILAQGATTLTGSASQQLIVGGSYTPLAGQKIAQVWVGADTANASAAFVGASGSPKMYIGSGDYRGFMVPAEDPSLLYCTGANGEKINWVIFG